MILSGATTTPRRILTVAPALLQSLTGDKAPKRTATDPKPHKQLAAALPPAQGQPETQLSSTQQQPSAAAAAINTVTSSPAADATVINRKRAADSSPLLESYAAVAQTASKPAKRTRFEQPGMPDAAAAVTPAGTASASGSHQAACSVRSTSQRSDLLQNLPRRRPPAAALKTPKQPPRSSRSQAPPSKYSSPARPYH